MKKSQILAALALAFALGVVAPVAGVYTNGTASAFNATNKTATGTDVQNAINAVSNNAKYAAFSTVYAFLNGYNPTTFDKGVLKTGEAIYADYDATLAGKAVDALAAADIAGLTAPIDGVGTTATPAPAADDGDDDAEEADGAGAAAGATVAQTKNVVAKITGNADYKIYAALYDAIEAEDVVALRKAVQAYNASPLNAKEKLNDASTDQTFNALKTVVEALAGYTNAEPLVEATEAARDNVTMYENGLKAFDAATKNILSGAGKGAVDGIKTTATTSKTPVVLGDLVDVIYNTTARATGDFKDENFTFSLNLWNDVFEEVYDATHGATQYDNGDTRNNYTLIEDIAKDYKLAANDNTPLDTLVSQFAKYKTPDTPDEGNTQPGTNVPNPGNTGIVGSAEGTAATTVSIVAGLATALTALGAGVVAYRSARREK